MAFMPNSQHSKLETVLNLWCYFAEPPEKKDSLKILENSSLYFVKTNLKSAERCAI